MQGEDAFWSMYHAILVTRSNRKELSDLRPGEKPTPREEAFNSLSDQRSLLFETLKSTNILADYSNVIMEDENVVSFNVNFRHFSRKDVAYSCMAYRQEKTHPWTLASLNNGRAISDSDIVYRLGCELVNSIACEPDPGKTGVNNNYSLKKWNY